MGRRLNLFRRLQFAKKAEIIVISSRHGHFLADIARGESSLVVDPTSFPIVLSIRYFTQFIIKHRFASRVARHILALASASRARVVLATDAIEELSEVAKEAQGIEVIAIMHGFYVDQRAENLREPWTVQRESSVSLFAFGEYDLLHYRRWGNVHKKIFPVGSGNNCLYLLEKTGDPEAQFDICLVQGSLNPHPTDNFSRIRLNNWELIVDFVSHLARSKNLTVAVSLNSSTKEDEIESWFKARLPRATMFKSSIDRFATYKAIDASRVSIGEASTALIEGLARKNKCIAINFSDLDSLSLPVPKIAALRNPSLAEFGTIVTNILAMEIEEYWADVEAQIRHLINVDEQHLVIEKIRSYIAEVCR